MVPGIAYWGVTTGDDEVPGINGGLLQRTSPRAEGGANAFVCVVEVDDYDAAESRILAAGGAVVDAKSAMPGMAWVGYYLDTEGNTVGLYQADENAA